MASAAGPRKLGAPHVAAAVDVTDEVLVVALFDQTGPLDVVAQRKY